jgi:Ca2+-binding EF-hand superfamily protein
LFKKNAVAHGEQLRGLAMKRTWALLLSTVAAVSACALPTNRTVQPMAGGMTAATSATQGTVRSALSGLVEQDLLRVFRLYDRNGDGYLTAAEADLPADVVKELDKDGDNRLSQAEMTPRTMVNGYATAIEGFAKEAFDQIDADHNGRVTTIEIGKAVILGALEQDLQWSRGILPDGWDRETFTRRVVQALGSQPEWKPFRTMATSKKTPVLLVQGYLEPSYYFMYGIYRHLQKQGWPVYGINLFPNVAHADVQARKVEAKIQAILKETGSPKINLVAHSFGGLISRQVIQKMGGDKYVDHYVSIATPHFGTNICHLPGTGDACIDMLPGSTYLADLNKVTTVSPVKYSAMYTKTDEITLPPRNCILPGAKNYPPVPLTGHFLILWSPTTYANVDDALQN